MTSLITPPRELIEQWASEKCYDERDWLYEIHIATRAAQWGYDQRERTLLDAMHATVPPDLVMPKTQLFEIDPHPAIPPADLLKEWEDLWFDEQEHADVLLIRAFQAGADQELEACCEWADISLDLGGATSLRAVRRPKPPSLKEQALQTLKYPKDFWSETEVDTIRRALEALSDD